MSLIDRFIGKTDNTSRRQMEKTIERLKVENEDLTESVEKFKPQALRLEREVARLSEENEELSEAVEKYQTLASQMKWLTQVAPKITWGAGSPAEATLYRMDFGEVHGENLAQAVSKAMARESQMRD